MRTMMLLRASGSAMQCSAELVGTRGRWAQQIRTGVMGPKKLVAAHPPVVASSVMATDAAKKASDGGGGGGFKWIVGTGLVLAGAGAALAAQQYVVRSAMQDVCEGAGVFRDGRRCCLLIQTVNKQRTVLYTSSYHAASNPSIRALNECLCKFSSPSVTLATSLVTRMQPSVSQIDGTRR